MTKKPSAEQDGGEARDYRRCPTCGQRFTTISAVLEHAAEHREEADDA